MKKVLAFVIGNFLSLVAFMKLLITLNKGDLIYNVLALAGIVLLGALLIKTRAFTKFNFKNKNQQK